MHEYRVVNMAIACRRGFLAYARTVREIERVGRPPNKNRDEVRTKVLPVIRVTTDEDETIRAGAEIAGRPLTTWAREVLLKAAKKLRRRR